MNVGSTHKLLEKAQAARQRDWACLKKERRKKNDLLVLRVPGVVLLRQFFATRGQLLLVMKTLEDEWYVIIKAYKCTISEIWRDFFLY